MCLTRENKITATSLHSSLVMSITNYSGKQIESHAIQILQQNNKKVLTYSIEEQTFLTIELSSLLRRQDKFCTHRIAKHYSCMHFVLSTLSRLFPYRMSKPFSHEYRLYKLYALPKESKEVPRTGMMTFSPGLSA